MYQTGEALRMPGFGGLELTDRVNPGSRCTRVTGVMVLISGAPHLIITEWELPEQRGHMIVLHIRRWRLVWILETVRSHLRLWSTGPC